ncbi:hypothetical protein F5B20DRAFT_232253 [Whalleya microplaca]|nr:hypothetical protein F5B20DRAFT_232253 [Whalleya microplaca]
MDVQSAWDDSIRAHWAEFGKSVLAKYHQCQLAVIALDNMWLDEALLLLHIRRWTFVELNSFNKFLSLQKDYPSVSAYVEARWPLALLVASEAMRKFKFLLPLATESVSEDMYIRLFAVAACVRAVENGLNLEQYVLRDFKTAGLADKVRASYGDMESTLNHPSLMLPRRVDEPKTAGEDAEGEDSNDSDAEEGSFGPTPQRVLKGLNAVGGRRLPTDPKLDALKLSLNSVQVHLERSWDKVTELRENNRGPEEDIFMETGRITNGLRIHMREMESEIRDVKKALEAMDIHVMTRAEKEEVEAGDRPDPEDCTLVWPSANSPAIRSWKRKKQTENPYTPPPWPPGYDWSEEASKKRKLTYDFVTFGRRTPSWDGAADVE